MDQAYVQGLRDAKALLDEGIFSEQEFMREKETLLKQREERIYERQRMGGLASAQSVRARKREREESKGAGAKPSKWAKYRKKCQHGKDAYECRACGGVGVPVLGGPAQPPPPPIDNAQQPGIGEARPGAAGAGARPVAR